MEHTSIFAAEMTLLTEKIECSHAQPFEGVGITESINMAIKKRAEKGLDRSPGGGRGGPYLIVYDGGHVTSLIHERVKAEEAFRMVLGLDESIQVDPLMKGRLVGVSEETTTGVQMQDSGTLPFAAINAKDSFTKIKLINVYECRSSPPDGLIAGKVAFGRGYGDVGKAFCAVQYVMEALPKDVFGTADIFVTVTGNKDRIMGDHMRKMKNIAINCNIGDSDNNFYNGFETFPDVEKFTVKPQMDKWVFPDTDSGINVVAEGRVMNLGCAYTGHPSFVMS